ncbi:hypothetical protein MAPG_00282 [Magnaporthiopsis poae ATCC 64411]|uniref:Uncharacterized protein n=1 Tax=Magnaporthiopsis poae (strain ATCC 64411 / 73-15) TaxID=644358 RepID=A0A0C4DKK7_MAGP6|nr:hypothetical protein MAPG_00282 [Magnaporthiopsis poae ATCC 64411]
MKAVSFISAVLLLASGASATAAPSSDLGVRSDVAAEEAPQMIAARWVGTTCKPGPRHKCLAGRPGGRLGGRLGRTEKRAIDVEEITKRAVDVEELSKREADVNEIVKRAKHHGGRPSPEFDRRYKNLFATCKSRECLIEKRAVEVEELSKRRSEAALARKMEYANRPGPRPRLPCDRKPGNYCLH